MTTPAFSESERITQDLKDPKKDRALLSLRIQNLLFYVNHPEVFERIKAQKIEILEDRVNHDPHP